MSVLGKNFRLPSHVQVHRYAPTLRIDLAGDRFAGEMDVDLELTAGAEEIRLHAVDLQVSVARIGDRVATVSADPESQTIGLRFPTPVEPGTHRLHIAWTGSFCDGLRGLYRAGPVAVTQFEAADARRVFPCLDEPAFKARWGIRLEGVPAGVTAISNGAATEDAAAADGSRTVTFADTPPMSSYLVALVLGELEGCAAEDVAGAPTRTWAVPDKKDLTGFGQMCARESLPRLRDYFGVEYIFGKLDQIGIPDFEAGAMENSGCVTYRETALLLDPETAPLRVKKIVAEIVTHELAHQWFGNLVTMVWWDDLWLNEAFATWMAYKIVDEWAPQWQMWMDFEVGKQAAFSLDALLSSHPIHSDVHNAEEAGEAFDAITYEKGGAVLRMIEGYIGEEAFRAGIRSYMQRHREANATGNDLWDALAGASDAPVRELANDWIHRTGFPVLSVQLDAGSGGVSLAQRRFLSDPAAQDDEARWMMPLVFRYRDDTGVRTHRVLMRDRAEEVALPHTGEVRWCIPNAGARGFFRTRHDAVAYAALLGSVAELDPAERMGLVSDAWALMQRGDLGAPDVLGLADRLSAERDHVVLDELVGCLAALEYRYVADGDRDRLRAWIAGRFAAAGAELGWEPAADEGERARLARAAVLRALVVVGRDPRKTTEAGARFAALLSDPEHAALDPNLLDVVVTVGARAASPADFETLRARARETVDPAPRRRFLHALTRAEDPGLAAQAVEISFTDEVPLQDYSAFTAGLLRNPVARPIAWDRIRGDFAAVQSRLSAPMIRTRFVESLAGLVTRAHLGEVDELLRTHELEGTRQARNQTLERLRLAVDLRDRLGPQIASWLQRDA